MKRFLWKMIPLFVTVAFLGVGVAQAEPAPTDKPCAKAAEGTCPHAAAKTCARAAKASEAGDAGACDNCPCKDGKTCDNCPCKDGKTCENCPCKDGKGCENCPYKDGKACETCPHKARTEGAGEGAGCTGCKSKCSKGAGS